MQDVEQSIPGLLLVSAEVVSMIAVGKSLLKYKKSWAQEQVLSYPATKIED
jgi:hypothetical protein